MDRTSRKPSLFRAPAMIFWTALGLRIAVIVIGRTWRVNPIGGNFEFGFEAGRIARALVTGHGYADPFNGHTGPTAWIAPGYPLLLALSFKLFGLYAKMASFFVKSVDSLFSAAIAPAIYEVAARCFDSSGLARRRSTRPAPIAWWSAWTWALYPAALQYAIHWLWDMSIAAMLFTWTIVFILRLARVGEAEGAPGEDARWGTWTLLGLTWGVLLLTNPSLSTCLPVELLWLAWRSMKTPQGFSLAPLGRLVAGSALVGALCLACLAPWILRNQRAMHAFVPTRSNLGVELYESTLEVNNGMPWGTSMPLFAGAPEYKDYVRLGEVEYSKRMGEVGKQRIHDNPGRFWRWTALRVQYYWCGLPHPEDRKPAQEYIRQLNYSFITVCGVLGLLLMFRQRVPGAGLIALIFLVEPLVYYGVTVQPRFRHPIEPLMTVLAVYLFRSADTSRTWSGRV
jgi:hypothetical protein